MMKPYLRDRQKEAKVSTVTGIVLTVTVHVLACLLCVFTGMKYIYPPPQEQTFLVDFSEDERSLSGDRTEDGSHRPRRSTRPSRWN